MRFERRGAAVIGAAIFLVVAAFPYFSMNQQRFGVYWPKRGWLLMHIVPAMIALATGPRGRAGRAPRRIGQRLLHRQLRIPADEFPCD